MTSSDTKNPVDLGMAEDVVQTPAGTIQAIDRGSVHRICSGQVVLTLATAVKELLENSIDAGATTIEIKLREYGSELIEVSDNGSGVEEKNFEGLTLKHHTSKLQDFADLVGVSTFGFRGEALSSLCALSGLSIITKHSSADVGTKIEYDRNGKITSKIPQARQKGTTVVLQNLFSTLPVRHKEFQRNLKKDFAKMVQVLNSYCIISTGVRITCSNQVGKGNRSVVVSSSGNTSMKENIANVFGPKQTNSLLEFKKRKPNEDISSEFGVKTGDGLLDLFDIEGFVSKCVHGQGRSSTDRQFYFVNNRPCDYVKIAKVVNEVYHQYNRHQYPFVALSFKMAKESVDVNVTPDKRQIFLQHEKLLLAVIKTSLIEMYEPTTSILQVNNTLQRPQSVSSFTSHSNSEAERTESCKQLTTENSEKISLSSSLNKLKRSFASAFAKEDNTSSPVKDTIVKQMTKQRKLDMFVSKTTPMSSDTLDKNSGQDNSSFKGCRVMLPERTESHTLDSDQVDSDQVDTESGISSSQETIGLTDSQSSVDSNLTKRADSDLTEIALGSSISTTSSIHTECFSSSTGNSPERTNTDGFISGNDTPDVLKTECFSSSCDSPNTQIFDSSCVSKMSNTDGIGSVCDASDVLKTECFSSSCDSPDTQIFNSLCVSNLSQLSYNDDTEKKDTCSNQDEEKNTTLVSCEISNSEDIDEIDSMKQEFLDNYNVRLGEPGPCTDESQLEKDSTIKITEYDKREDVKKKENKVKFNFNKLKKKFKRNSEKNPDESEEFCRSFRAKISPSDNQAAEEELQKEIKKDMFEKMEILGQFNLGFIITLLGEDLFIVDQHATDEKYNFEMLQRHTVLQNQKLIQPQCLELTASNETILMDNLEVFKKNGFDFIINEEGPPTQRVKLTSVPVSKNWNFGKDDIEELIFMLTDSPGVMCRPSRVRQMFASRACRKSIMIGTALNQSEMKKLVSHMGDIAQPWNCPHGRPTMRHLINLKMVPR